MKRTHLLLAAIVLASALLLISDGADAEMVNTTLSLAPLQQISGLTTFLGLFNPVLLERILDVYSGITLLMPSNAAFDDLGTTILAALVEEYNSDLLRTVVLYHMLDRPFNFQTILELMGFEIPTLFGSSLPVQQSGTGALEIAGAKIVQSDLPFLRGSPTVIHIIDRLLIPPNTVTLQTINETLASFYDKGRYTLFYRALLEFDSGSFQKLLDDVAGNGLTLFLPTDDAFKDLPANLRTFPLTADSKLTLDNVIRNHIVQRSLSVSQIEAQPRLTVYSGKTLKVRFNGDTGYPSLNQGNIVDADKRVLNGMIHIVDKVLRPRN